MRITVTRTMTMHTITPTGMIMHTTITPRMRITTMPIMTMVTRMTIMTTRIAIMTTDRRGAMRTRRSRASSPDPAAGSAA